MNPLKPPDIFGPFGRFRRDSLRGGKLVASRKIDEDRRIDEWKDIKKKENSQ